MAKIADKYKDFIDKKPTKAEYIRLSNSLNLLLIQQNKLNRLNIKIIETVSETRKILEDYKFMV